MYRPPIRGGRDAIGSAIGAGLASGAAAVAGGFDERRRREEEEARKAEEQRRYDEAQRRAAEARELDLLRMGRRRVSEAEAYDPITTSIALPQAPVQAGAPGEPAAPHVVAPVRQAALAGPGRRRENVDKIGENFYEFDPRTSDQFRTSQAASEAAAEAEQAEITRRAGIIQAADPSLSTEDAIAMAVGENPLSWEEQLGRRGEELEQSDVYNAREAARREGAARRGLTANQEVLRQGEEVDRISQAAAYEIDLAGVEDPRARYEGTKNLIRVYAAEQGVELSDSEVDAYAAAALQGSEQRRVRTKTLRAEEALQLGAELVQGLRDAPPATLEERDAEAAEIYQALIAKGVRPSDAAALLGDLMPI